MKRINSSYKLVEFLSARRGGADTVVNVATIEIRFRAIVLIEKFVLDAQAPQAQNTWCMRPLMYIENCMGKITDRKKIV